MRVINERWEAVEMGIEHTEEQRSSPEGFPMMRPDGSPDMQPLVTLVFTHNTPGERYIVRIPFDEDGKRRLIEALSGAQIHVASPSDILRLQ